MASSTFKSTLNNCEVGYGLEYALTDAQASSLLHETVLPAFARGRYESGIEDFLSALDKLLASSEAAAHRASHRSSCCRS